MMSTQALREQLDRYESGAISAEALEEWLASESWDMRRWVPIGLQRLIEAIQATFIQYSDGQITSDDLHADLLRRHEQLHRAEQATKELLARRASEEKAVEQGREYLRTEAFTVAVPAG
jgi:hypothetical protein